MTVDTTLPRAGGRRRGRWTLWVLVAALIAAVAGAYFTWFATYHFVIVDKGKLYRDGNRGIREFRNAVRQSGARTVISIVDDTEVQAPEFRDEEAYLAQHGIEYVRIPIRKGRYPTNEQLKQFLAIASDPVKQPVLYHDNEGIRRAGMMMAAYQESVLGYDDARAKAAIQRFGHSDRTLNDVVRFIEGYDGRTREVVLTR
jgi:protein tyrosine phosphatase (PTP) superfamily phosphohydrolase (DUF442 family)